MIVAPPIVIIGAGPVGLTLALLLKRGGSEPLLIDARTAETGSRADPRAIALAAGSRQLLERVGAWPAAATAIREIHVSQLGGFGRTLIEARDHRLSALGHVVRYDALSAALAAAARVAGVAVRYACPALGVVRDTGSVTVHTPQEPLDACLLVHAEGAADDDDVARCDYAQDAIVCEATPAEPHKGRAWERFTPGGPIALLPVGDAYAVVYVAAREASAALLAQDDAGFLAAMQARLGGTPRLIAVGRRSRFPLMLRLRPRLARGAEVWIGNAAQTLHPVSGQGLNLGLRDAAELADALLEALARNDDFAGAARNFACRRQPDRLLSLAFTDGIIRVFGNDLPPLRLARGLGISLLDLARPLRRAFADRLMFGTRI